jgi:hypothetical protein
MKIDCIFRMGVLAAATCAFAGCPASRSSAVQEESHDAPAHKPAGFVDAVQVIRVRLAQFQGIDRTADRQVLLRQAGEMKDIIQWLPELAAETDLRKADWEHVSASSQRMLARWTEAAPRLVDGNLQLDDAGLASLKRDLDSLDGLVQTRVVSSTREE